MNIAADPQFPAKWPFPPAPPARRPFGHGRPAGRSGHAAAPVAGDGAAAPGMAASPATGGVSKRQMVVDVLLVAMWGGMIPGLMWLGAAAGF